ncbi:SIR2 family NAD-dependent protein deacylase [Saccharibacillus brassicae]|uniref:protein acetyllysine N-acetyltransferase n=1 Tax=Saccharibacillus brassicae TaxID=2583377 RepID=A0A4Y6UT50_SACBS|nr:NAD-dependent protein deacylase [Saccharibacillus brassicae]QDH19546.1 NAD-dependent protein deacylase [Saccharibacillus brassicae]
MQTIKKIEKVVELIQHSRSTVIFTGAGVSTASGIPDFRSSDGLWHNHDPLKVSHVKLVYEDPKSLFSFYADRYREFITHEPNGAHRILAKWQQDGLINKVVTQNIDDYHQQAGSKNVIELHGNMEVRCQHCNRLLPASRFLKGYGRCQQPSLEIDEMCNGILRPNVVLFGEELPQKTFKQASKAHMEAELCIIIGSSCSIYPANLLPRQTVSSNNGKIVIINKGETELDHLASVKISEWEALLSLQEIDRSLQKT